MIPKYKKTNLSDRADLYQPIPLNAFAEAAHKGTNAESLQNVLLSLGVLTWRDLVGLTSEALKNASNKDPTIFKSENIFNSAIKTLQKMLKKIDPKFKLGAVPSNDRADYIRITTRRKAEGVENFHHVIYKVPTDELHFRRHAIKADDAGHNISVFPAGQNSSHIQVDLRDENDSILATAFLRVGQQIKLQADGMKKPVWVSYSNSTDTKTAFSIES
jgi:hypothetical protein